MHCICIWIDNKGINKKKTTIGFKLAKKLNYNFFDISFKKLLFSIFPVTAVTLQPNFDKAITATIPTPPVAPVTNTS